MKKSTAIIATALFLALFIGFSVFYAKVYKPAHSKEQTSSLYYADGMKKKHAGKKTLLAELPELDYHLYQDGDYVILMHGGKEFEFDNWSPHIADETPQMYYFDINTDNEKELIIRALEGTDEQTGENYYCVYVLFEKTDENGNPGYDVAFANKSTWFGTFDSIVNCEVSQPSINKKRIQLVMAHSMASIVYNSETGIVKDARAWYIKALSDGKNNYYTFKDWYLGPAIINVDTENECLNIQINLYIQYNEIKETQIGGVLRCGLDLEGRTFTIMNKSVGFDVDRKYKTTSLLQLAESSWQYIFHNTESYSSSNKTISTASFRCTLSEESMEEYSIFSGSTAETKAIDRIILTENTIKLYAKKGYSFSPDIINHYKYSITVFTGGIENDITLSASAAQEDGTSVLIFNLDKNYPHSELKNFNVKLGV